MEATRAAVICVLAQLLTASIAILQVDLLSSCSNTVLLRIARAKFQRDTARYNGKYENKGVFA